MGATEYLRSSIDMERHVIARMIREFATTRSSVRVLDVGCGYGRNLASLMARGLEVVGVDVDAAAVETLRASGSTCFLADEPGWRGEYDVILMSHVIEHLTPLALVDFIDTYAKHLRIGGHLIIATPLLTDYFFDDFSHVKPYHPESIIMVFGRNPAQISMRAKTKLALTDLWFRRSAFRLRRVRSSYIGPLKPLLTLVNASLAGAYLLSFGLLGRKDGWVGAFRKVSE